MMMLVASCGWSKASAGSQTPVGAATNLEDLDSLVDPLPPCNDRPRQEERSHKAAQSKDPHSPLPPRIILHPSSSHAPRKSNQPASDDREWPSE